MGQEHRWQWLWDERIMIRNHMIGEMQLQLGELTMISIRMQLVWISIESELSWYKKSLDNNLISVTIEDSTH